jgi:hypothetical protein
LRQNGIRKTAIHSTGNSTCILAAVARPHNPVNTGHDPVQSLIFLMQHRALQGLRAAGWEQKPQFAAFYSNGQTEVSGISRITQI